MNSIKENFPLVDYNTFHIAATARYFVDSNQEESVQEICTSSLLEQNPYFVLGGGSNVLFTKDFGGVIIHPGIRGIEIVTETNSEVMVRIGAGENWDETVAWCVDQGWGGIENLSWIPGSAGAAPVQNIGAYGVEIKDYVEKVEGIRIGSGNKFSLSARECKFSYRNSIFKNELKKKVIITYVTLKLFKNPVFNTGYPDLQKEMKEYDETSIQNIRKAVIKIRKFKLPDPAETGNAGSFFKNPIVKLLQSEEMKKLYPGLPAYDMNDGTVKLSAAWLIEQAGWKGKNCGNAGTHDRQPLILINLGNATGKEILHCAEKIRNSVMNKFGINLEMEVNIV